MSKKNQTKLKGIKTNHISAQNFVRQFTLAMFKMYGRQKVIIRNSCRNDEANENRTTNT